MSERFQIPCDAGSFLTQGESHENESIHQLAWSKRLGHGQDNKARQGSSADLERDDFLVAAGLKQLTSHDIKI